MPRTRWTLIVSGLGFVFVAGAWPVHAEPAPAAPVKTEAPPAKSKPKPKPKPKAGAASANSDKPAAASSAGSDKPAATASEPSKKRKKHGKAAEVPVAAPAANAAPMTPPAATTSAAAASAAVAAAAPAAKAPAAPPPTAAKPTTSCSLLEAEQPRGGRLELVGSGFGQAPLVRIAGKPVRMLERREDRISVQVPAQSDGGPVSLQSEGRSTACGQLVIIGKNR